MNERAREHFPDPPWPSDVDELREGEQYDRRHPVTGDVRRVEVVEIDESGPGVVTQYQEI